MKTSLRGICSMLAEEAIVLSTYADSVGVLTIGAGHTAAAGQPIPVRGMTITLVEAINLFREDLKKYEREVLAAVRRPLSQNQFDAVVSWHFNTGAVASATLTQKLNAGNDAGAATEFARWNKADGKVSSGLVARRKRETAIFTNADYGNRPIPVMERKGGRVDTMSSEQIASLIEGVVSDTEEAQTTEELLANPLSQLLPRFRPRQSSAVTRAALQKFRDLIPPDRHGDAVMLLAVRGYYANTMGAEGVNDRSVYDDAIFVVEPEGVHNFNANTDPSKFRRGIATLKSPQAVLYIPGPHGFSRPGGPYPAFRQHGNVTVVRDQTGDDTDSPNRRFWINIHRGGNTTTSSAGCQTVPPHQWNEFKSLVDNLLRKYGQETFYYVLVDQPDVPAEESVMVDVTTGGQRPAQQDVLAEALVHLQALLRLLRGEPAVVAPARTMPTPTLQMPVDIAASMPAQTGTSGLLLALLQTLVSANAPKVIRDTAPFPESPRPKPAEVEVKVEAPLTQVNGALGQTIGRALDGKKTALGITGLLATTVLPIFFPQLAIPVAAAGAVLETGIPQTIGQQAMEVATPVFAALTGWGVLGKVEKWVRAVVRS